MEILKPANINFEKKLIKYWNYILYQIRIVMDYTIKKVFMTDLEDLLNENAALELKPEIKELLMQAADALKGPDRRLFMAETVRFLGKGGQRKAERELGLGSGNHPQGDKGIEFRIYLRR